MTTSTTPFAILVELDGDGAHPAAWRFAAHSPTELLSPSRIAATVRAAERAGFTAATFEDSPLPPGQSFSGDGRAFSGDGQAFSGDGQSTTAGRGGRGIIGRIEAIQRAAFSAPLTSSLGLVAVAHAVYGEPFHLSTQLATVDHVSDGRAGWLVGTDADAAIAAEYGRAAVSAEQAIADAADTVEVSRRLWDSWEDDAVIRERETGRYFDRDRVHYADFTGESFSIIGPAIVPRPPQGQVVVFAEGAVAARLGADVALVTSIEQAADIRTEDIRTSVHRTLLELEVVLDSAGVSAADRLTALNAHDAWTPTPRARFVGTGAELIALLTELASDEVIDGVRLIPAVLDVDLDEIGRGVLPELRRRAVFRSPAPGQTMRQSLGLERPANRFAVDAPADEPGASHHSTATLEGASA